MFKEIIFLHSENLLLMSKVYLDMIFRRLNTISIGFPDAREGLHFISKPVTVHTELMSLFIFPFDALFYEVRITVWGGLSATRLQLRPVG